MIIDVWSDVVCPWCYIGKRRLEKALANFDNRDGITIRHRAFQLQSDIQEIVPTSEYLAEKYRIPAEQVKKMQANVCTIADGEGLCYDLDATLSGNTFDAHRLLLWASTIGKQSELLEAMYSAYFEKSMPLFTHDDLLDVTESIGIERDAAKSLLESQAFIEEVVADRDLGAQLGITGVPFFVFDMKYGISGAQPLEVFEETLKAAWDENSEGIH